jgi:hypothetical protein
VLPRGGSSSLAGQTVGPGCVVIDFSKDTGVYRDGSEDRGQDSEHGVGADMRDYLRSGAAYESGEPATNTPLTSSIDQR